MPDLRAFHSATQDVNLDKERQNLRELIRKSYIFLAFKGLLPHQQYLKNRATSLSSNFPFAEPY